MFPVWVWLLFEPASWAELQPKTCWEPTLTPRYQMIRLQTRLLPHSPSTITMRLSRAVLNVIFFYPTDKNPLTNPCQSMRICHPLIRAPESSTASCQKLLREIYKTCDHLYWGKKYIRSFWKPSFQAKTLSLWHKSASPRVRVRVNKNKILTILIKWPPSIIVILLQALIKLPFQAIHLCLH